MARKKPEKPKSSNVTPNAVVVRGSTEWRQWLVGLAETCQLSQADTIAQALMILASQKGYRPMPRRQNPSGAKP